MSNFSRGQIVVSIKCNGSREVLLLCNCWLCIFLTCVGNECHPHMLVETSAISADSHVCSGLLSRVEKQLGVNRRKRERLHMSSASRQITSNCSLYSSLSLYWFYSKAMLHHLTNNFWGKCSTAARNGSSEVFWR